VTRTWFISDTHFGHTNSWAKFKSHNDPDKPMRPFTSTEEMDETMINNWNKVVHPKDRVYHLGDFCINRKSLNVFSRLHGRICLVLGNHDPWKRSDYDKFAPNIDVFQGAKMLPKIGWVLTHIPVYSQMVGPDSRWQCNIHGHLHDKKVLCEGYDGWTGWASKPDPRYFNVSVEQINYTPIELEELKTKVPYRK
jgi:calcineurin-like phosphoesterase family protein